MNLMLGIVVHENIKADNLSDISSIETFSKFKQTIQNNGKLIRKKSS